VSLGALLRVFGTLGVASFGGGLSGWIYREVVEVRQWLAPREFLTGLSLARTLPGINVVNLAIWIGYRLRRGWGALAAAMAVIGGPIIAITGVAMVYRRWGHTESVHQALIGVVAAALGLSLSLGVKSLRTAAPRPFYALITIVLFVAIGLLHWPMIPLVTAVGSLSVVWSFVMDSVDEE
jgi:chromate transporter